MSVSKVKVNRIYITASELSENKEENCILTWYNQWPQPTQRRMSKADTTLLISSLESMSRAAVNKLCSYSNVESSCFSFHLRPSGILVRILLPETKAT